MFNNLSLLFPSNKANRTVGKNELILKYSDPELSGQTIHMCFPSMAPQKFGKFYISKKSIDTFVKLLSIGSGIAKFFN